MHIHRGHTGSNQPRCRPVKAKSVQNARLAMQKDEVQHSIQKYWQIRHELAMIDVIAMKGK